MLPGISGPMGDPVWMNVVVVIIIGKARVWVQAVVQVAKDLEQTQEQDSAPDDLGELVLLVDESETGGEGERLSSSSNSPWRNVSCSASFSNSFQWHKRRIHYSWTTSELQ